MIVYLVVHEDYDVYDILGAYDNKTAAYAHINDGEFIKKNGWFYNDIAIHELIVDSVKDVRPHKRVDAIFQRTPHD